MSCVQVHTDIPFFLTKAEEGMRSLGNWGCWDVKGRKRGWSWATALCFSSFVPARHNAARERVGLAVEKLIWLKHSYWGVKEGWTCTLEMRKSEKRAEGIHKEECMRLAPFEDKSLG